MFPQKHKLKLLGAPYARTGYLIALCVFLFASMFAYFSLLRVPQTAHAATSSTLSFQARLYNSDGSIVDDGYYNVEFKIYDASSSSGSSQGSCAGDANCLWTETLYDTNGGTAGNDYRVRVVNGYFSVYLGDTANGGTAFPGTIDWDQELWLTLNIGGSTQTASPTYDGEMSPRIKLTAVPYAFTAGGITDGSGNRYTGDDLIQNQNTGDQTGNFRISGTGRANTSLTTPLLDSISGGLSLGTSTATGVTIGGTANTTAVALQGAAAATYTIGTSNNTGGITVGNSTATNTISIGSSVGASNTQTINIGTSSTGSSTTNVTIGSTVAGVTTLQSQGGINIDTFATLAGSLALEAGTDFSTTGTSNNVDFGAVSLIRLTGASAQTITGIANGTDGEILTIVNAASQSATISNQSGSSTAANRIITGTGSDISLLADASITLIYDSSASRWRTVGAAAITGSGSFIENGTTTQTANFNVQSANAGNVTATIQGASSQTADILQVLADGVGNPLFEVGPTGQAIFRNSSDSANAFRVQNAAGTTTVLNVNTSTSLVSLNGGADATIADATSGQLVLGDTSSTNLVFDDNEISARDNGAISSLYINPDGGGTYFGTSAAGTFNVNNGQLNIASGGATTFQNGSDSTTAFQIQNSAGTSDLFVADTSNSKVGIATTPSSGGATLQVGGTLSVSSTAAFGSEATVSGERIINTQQSYSGTNSAYGIWGSRYQTGGSNSNRIVGVNGLAETYELGAGNTLTWAVGLQGTAGNNGGTNAGTVTNAAALYASNTKNSGTLQNGYGVYVENQTSATNDYGIYIQGADTYALFVDSGDTRLDGNLQVAGSVAFQAGTDFSTTGTSNNVDFGAVSLVRLTGASTQTITGIANGTDGEILTIINASGNSATLSNESGSSTAANRIITGTGSDITLLDDSSITLVYDSSDSRWRAVGAAAVAGGAATTLQSAYDNGSAGDQVITLDATQDSLIFRNPASGGSDSNFILTVDQLQTSATGCGGGTCGALNVTNAGTSQAVRVIQTGNTSASTSSGGAVNITNTSNTGAGLVVYSNQSAPSGRLFVVRSDNASFNQSAAYIEQGGTGAALQITQNNVADGGNGGSGLTITADGGGGSTSGAHALSVNLTGTGNTNASALNITSSNAASSAVQISGSETGRGTLKVTHTGTGSDTNASAISIDLAGSGTAAQGIFLDATGGGTTGKLLNLRNDGTEVFTLNADGSVLSKNGSDSTTAFQIQNAAGSYTLLTADTTNGRIGIGTLGTETGQLYVSGNIPTAATATLGSGGGLGAGPDAIKVVGNYAYIASFTDSTLEIVDISDPTTPEVVSSTALTGTGPEDLVVAGKYVYVANYSDDSFEVLDVSDPTSPSTIGSITVDDGPRALAVSGRYAYLVNNLDSSLQVIDVANPDDPVVDNTFTTSVSGPKDIEASGGYVYIANDTGQTLQIVDVSDPTTPSNVDTEAIVTAPLALAVNGRYVYMSDQTNSIYVLDVSNPSTIVELGSFASGADIEQLIVQGRFMYGVSNNGASSALYAYDISDPASPTNLTSVAVGDDPYHLDVVGRYAYVTSYTDGTLGVFDVGGAYIQQLEAGGIRTSTFMSDDAIINDTLLVGGSINVSEAAQINGFLGAAGPVLFKNAADSVNAFQVQDQTGTQVVFNVDTSNSRVGIMTAAPSYDLSFGDDTNKTIGVEDRSSNAAGRGLTISAGGAGAGGSAFTGGTLSLQGGDAAGSGNAVGGGVTITGGQGVGTSNGGDVTISGGSATGTGVQGLVNLSTTAFTSTSTQAFAVSGSLSAGLVDQYSTIPINATGSDVTVTIPAPNAANQTTGRVLYIAAVNASNDFTISLAGTSVEIALKANSTATLIWNGTGWTAAGASSSTDLQSAYDNTLTSAGGAELVLNAPGGNADGLTIRNNSTTPITGAIFETQTSIGSNLFSVNNNATEYADNGGAESSTFTMWTATPDGGTISRYTTAGSYIATGQGSVSVVTSATADQGVRNTLASTLTANSEYKVSFAVRSTSNFSTLDVDYSPDGTNTGLVACSADQTVTEGKWTRISCSFTAPSSGITSSNAIFIKHSDATARTFYVDNLSVNVSAAANHATDGSVDLALGSNWTAYGTLDSLTRDTSVIYDTSGSVNVNTPNASDRGVRNNLSIAPATDTQYLVTFYVRSSNTFNDIEVVYSRDGGSSSFIGCVDYNTQSVSTSAFTKITCLFTTDGTSASDPDLIIWQPTGSDRNFYIDALSVTLNTNTASNVQIGGGNLGGPATLFTLDRSDGAPIADNNDAYLGSMYYDTTTGRIQCYEADGWGACGAAPDNYVNLNPEYSGAVLNGSGVGTMTADLCSNETGVLQVNNSLCDPGETRNYYRWTSPQATQQTYSIYVSYQLPETFNGFASDDTVQLVARADSTTNAAVTYEMYRSTGDEVTQCGSGETTVVTTADTWQSVGINGNESTGCSFTSSAAGDFLLFKINLKANSNANAYVSTLSFTTTGR